MERYRTVLRARAGKLTEGLRGRLSSLGAWIGERTRAIFPRRWVAAAGALSLWMGVGGMDSSGVATETEVEVFGEVHWYGT